MTTASSKAPNATIRFPPIRPPCHLPRRRASGGGRLFDEPRQWPCDHAPMARDITQVRKLRDADAFDAHLAAIGTVLPRHPDPGTVLSRPLDAAGRTLANRWVVLPMEGWD